MRGVLVAGSSDMIAVRVSGASMAYAVGASGSFVTPSPPGPTEEDSHARIVLYTGSQPPPGGLTVDDTTDWLNSQAAQRVWLDHLVRYGKPFEMTWPIGAEPMAQAGQDLWLVMGCPLDSAGVTFNAIASLGLWGRDAANTQGRGLR